MKVKLQIKNKWTGSILFEYEKEDNSIKETLVEAIKHGAYLQGADLQGADLWGADLRGADLQGAYLQGAYLQGADLRGADLWGADLRGVRIKKAAVFTGLYTYTVIPYITEQNEKRIRMGCYDRNLQEWEADFWNNPNEFPNDGSQKSQMRLMAFNTAKAWFDIVEDKTKLNG